jgi:hypothetical protein
MHRIERKHTMHKLLSRMAASGVALLLLGAGGPAALAQAGGGQPLRELDMNGDGKITREEVAKAADLLFTRADTNGDGSVSKEEFRAMQDQRFAAADANGDGEITRADMAGRLTRLRDR